MPNRTHRPHSSTDSGPRNGIFANASRGDGAGSFTGRASHVLGPNITSCQLGFSSQEPGGLKHPQKKFLVLTYVHQCLSETIQPLYFCTLTLVEAGQSRSGKLSQTVIRPPNYHHCFPDLEYLDSTFFLARHFQDIISQSKDTDRRLAFHLTSSALLPEIPVAFKFRS